MKFLVLIVLTFIECTSFAKSKTLADANKSFVDCFKGYFCGEVPVEVPLKKNELASKKRQVFFNTVTNKCLAAIQELNIRYIDTGDNTIFQYILSDSKTDIRTFMGCSPSRNFETIMTENYSKNPGRKALLPESMTSDIDKPCEDRSKGRYGCTSFCGSDEIYKIFPKNLNPSLKYVGRSQVGLGSNVVVTYRISDILDGMNMEVSPEAFAQGFEGRCLKCSDPEAFPNLAGHHKDTLNNICLDKYNCTANEEFVPSLNRCEKKCSNFKIRNKNGICTPDLASCRMFKQALSQLESWYVLDSAKITNIHCSKEAMFQIMNDYYKMEHGRLSNQLYNCQSGRGGMIVPPASLSQFIYGLIPYIEKPNYSCLTRAGVDYLQQYPYGTDF